MLRIKDQKLNDSTSSKFVFLFLLSTIFASFSFKAIKKYFKQKPKKHKFEKFLGNNHNIIENYKRKLTY